MRHILLLLLALGSAPARASCASFSRAHYCDEGHVLAIVGAVVARSAPYSQDGYTLTDVTVKVERRLQGPPGVGEAGAQVTFPVVGHTGPGGEARGGEGGAPRLDVGSHHRLLLAVGAAGARASLYCGGSVRVETPERLLAEDVLRAQWQAACAGAGEGTSGPPVIRLLGEAAERAGGSG